MDADHIELDTFIRIQLEYLEMPGLKLTRDQVVRLCGLTREASDFTQRYPARLCRTSGR